MENDLYTMSTTDVGKYAKVFLENRIKALGGDLIDYKLAGSNMCARIKGKYYKFKVKSIRKPNTRYIKIKKSDVDIEDDSLFIAIILFYEDGISKIFLIPVAELANENNLFRNRNYLKMKSSPEWGLNVTDKNMDILSKFQLSIMLKKLS